MMMLSLTKSTSGTCRYIHVCPSWAQSRRFWTVAAVGDSRDDTDVDTGLNTATSIAIAIAIVILIVTDPVPVSDMAFSVIQRDT